MINISLAKVQLILRNPIKFREKIAKKYLSNNFKGFLGF